MDIIGIGALNIDYIKSMPWFLSHSTGILRQEFEPGREEWVTNENISQRIHQIGTSEFDIGPGGSAFNTIRCLAQLGLGLKIGYIGIAGLPSDGCDLKEHLSRHSIDSTWVYSSSNPSGKCISLYWPRDRSRGLRTAPGVDGELAAKLSDLTTQTEITNYVAKAKWVHLTSFVNQECLSLIVGILKKAKAANQHLIISFDPGSEYCRNPTAPIKEAIRISDYLFLNWKEFCQLAGYEEANQLKRGKVNENEIASNLFMSLNGPKVMIVLKSYNSTRFFQIFRSKILVRRFWQIPLSPLFVRDDTGAGDIFAAGLISSQFIPALSFDMRTAILLCSRLVKSKLKVIGCDAELDYQKALNNTFEEIRLREGLNIKDLGRVYFSQIAGFFLGVVVTSIIDIIVTLIFR